VSNLEIVFPGADLFFTQQCDLDFVPRKSLVPRSRVLIFSNVKYPQEKKVLTRRDDVLVFINKANCAEFYQNDPVERFMVWRRKDDPAFGEPLEFGENHTVFPEVPGKFIDDLKRCYDWDFPIWDGRHGDMTTGYIVIKYMESLYPDREIVLVNMGYEVKHSTRRTPNHNWKFEAQELEKYRHIYTAEKMDFDEKKIRIFYDQYGWLGDNIYTSAVLENIVNDGRFAVNVNPQKHPELWEKCPFLDRSITRENADYVCRQRYRGMWRIGCKHIIEGTLRTLCDDIGFDIPVTVRKPKIWLDLPTERMVDGDYWIINTGWQDSCPIKKWNRSYWEKLIAMAPPGKKIVQVGQSRNHATPLPGAINMIDKTTVPELVRLVRDAECVISPPSGVIHIAAVFDRPFVSIAGGREPESYGTYPCGITLANTGGLSCCRRFACRKNFLTKGVRACQFPELEENGEFTARCMNMITPEMVLCSVRNLVVK